MNISALTFNSYFEISNIRIPVETGVLLAFSSSLNFPKLECIKKTRQSKSNLWVTYSSRAQKQHVHSLTR